MPHLFEPTAENFKKDFNPKSKRFVGKPMEVQRRVVRILNRQSLIAMKKSLELRDRMSRMLRNFNSLERDVEQFSNQKKFRDEIERIIKENSTLSKEISEQQKLIKKSEKLGQRVMENFHPGTFGIYKSTNLERTFHYAWKLLDSYDETLKGVIMQANGLLRLSVFLENEQKRK